MRGALTAARLAYRLDGSDEEWLAPILDAAYGDLGRGLGAWMATYDARDPARLHFGAMVGVGMFRGWRTAIRLGVRLVPRALTLRAVGSLQVGTMSQVLGARFAASHPTSSLVGALGVRDTLGLNAVDPRGEGCVLSVHLPQLEAAPRAVVEPWLRVAAHLAAGHRLRRFLRQAPSPSPVEQGAEAVLDASGRVEHAEGKGQGAAAQQLLRQAARLLTELDGVASGVEAARALAAWQGLVAGRWSVVDQFVAGGRRHFIARRNDPQPSGPTELTLRQRQVVVYAAMGHANKLIAYELGLSEVAVSNHLRRAAERLGAASRAELIARFVAQAGSPTR